VSLGVSTSFLGTSLVPGMKKEGVDHSYVQAPPSESRLGNLLASWANLGVSWCRWESPEYLLDTRDEKRQGVDDNYVQPPPSSSESCLGNLRAPWAPPRRSLGSEKQESSRLPPTRNESFEKENCKGSLIGKGTRSMQKANHSRYSVTT
jgi:hypothetical protein